tara:strand:- start:534 stop:869 length:336 start_codon:yes stop_codon:yes gene_type:complete
MKFARTIVVLLLVATWSSTFTIVNAEDSDDVALVGFDFENGFSTNHTTVITGSVEDEVKPASVTWSIEGDSELDSGISPIFWRRPTHQARDLSGPGRWNLMWQSTPLAPAT